ncbi:ataxin-2 protein isoform X1, partial [Tropilaelaps mercedesae]
MNQQGTDKKRNVKSNGTAGPRSVRGNHQQGGGGKANSDRTVLEKAAAIATGTNAIPPSSLGSRNSSVTTGTTNSIIANSINNINSNLNNIANNSENVSGGNGGGGAAARNSDSIGMGRDRNDGLATIGSVGPISQQQQATSSTVTSAVLGGSGVSVVNNVGPGSPRDAALGTTASTGLTQAPNGVYTNARFMHAVAALVGHTVEVRVRGEKDTYEGLFYTISPELEIALDGVLVGSPEREQNSPDSRGDLSLDSSAAAQSAPGHLAGLVRNMDRLKNADSPSQPLQETMVFSLKDVISVTAYNIDMDYATKDNAFTDAAISRGANGRPIERDLQAWMDDEPEGKSIEEGQLEDISATTSWDPEEMFKTNKSKFGVETTYQENLEGYTYQIEQRDDPEFQRREAEAVRIALEIESNPQHKRNIELEIGCDGDDEELKYSAVVKDSRNESRVSYAHPGGRRNKQVTPNANGGQAKGGVQQRSGASHPPHHPPGNSSTRGGHNRSPPLPSPAPHTPLAQHPQASQATNQTTTGQSRPSPPIKDEVRRGPAERSPAARVSPSPKMQPQQQQQQQQQDKQEKQREDKNALPVGGGHGPSQQPPSALPVSQQQPHVSAVHGNHEGKRSPPLGTPASTTTPVVNQPPAGQQQSGMQQPRAGTPQVEAVKSDHTPTQQPPQTPSPAPAVQPNGASSSTDEIVKKSTLNPNAEVFVFNPKTTHVAPPVVTHNKQNMPPTSVMHTGGHPAPNRSMLVQHHGLIMAGPPVFQAFQGHAPGHGGPSHGHGGHQTPGGGGTGGHQGGGGTRPYRGGKNNSRQAVEQTMHVTGAPLVTAGPPQHQQVVLGYPPPAYGAAPPPGVPPGVTVMQPQLMQHGQQVVLPYNSIVQTRGVMSPPAGPGVGGVGSPQVMSPIYQGEHALHIAAGHQQVFLRDQHQLLYPGFDGAPGQAVAFVVNTQPPGGGGGQSGAPTPPNAGVGGPHGGPHGQQPLLAYPGQPQWTAQPMLVMSPINPSGGGPTGTPPPHHAHMNMVMPGPPPLGPPHGSHPGQHAPPHGPPFAPQAVVPQGPPGVPVPPNALQVPPGVPQGVGGPPGAGGPPSSGVASGPNGPTNQPPPAPTSAQQGPPPLAAPQQPQQPPPPPQ